MMGVNQQLNVLQKTEWQDLGSFYGYWNSVMLNAFGAAQIPFYTFWEERYAKGFE
jgi:hypothetical protein